MDLYYDMLTSICFVLKYNYITNGSMKNGNFIYCTFYNFEKLAIITDRKDYY